MSKDIFHKYCLIALIGGISLYLFPAKPVVLNELVNPKMIAIDQNHIYISDQNKILVSSIDDGILLRDFGRKGEGPQEFRQSPYIQILSDSYD